MFDLLVRKDEDGRISTTHFCKKIVGNTILRADSAHPQPLVTSIPYGQYIKLKRKIAHRILNSERSLTCYVPDYWKEDIAIDRSNGPLTEWSVGIGWNYYLNLNPPKYRIPTKFITRYNTSHQHIRNILSEYWYSLADNEHIVKFTTPHPSIT